MRELRARYKNRQRKERKLINPEERVSLGRRVREASLKVREDALQYEYASEFDAADSDGL